jgi:hypothetical protein
MFNNSMMNHAENSGCSVQRRLLRYRASGYGSCCIEDNQRDIEAGETRRMALS